MKREGFRPWVSAPCTAADGKGFEVTPVDGFGHPGKVPNGQRGVPLSCLGGREVGAGGGDHRADRLRVLVGGLSGERVQKLVALGGVAWSRAIRTGKVGRRLRRSLFAGLPTSSDAGPYGSRSSRIWKAIPSASPKAASASVRAGLAPASVAPIQHAAEVSAAVLRRTISM